MLSDEQFKELLQEITSTRTDLGNFRRELLGNGQPGRIQRIEAEIGNTQNAVKTLQLASAEARGRHARLAAYISTGISAIGTALSFFIRHK